MWGKSSIALHGAMLNIIGNKLVYDPTINVTQHFHAWDFNMVIALANSYPEWVEIYNLAEGSQTHLNMYDEEELS